MMKQTFRKLAAVLLAVSILTGILPANPARETGFLSRSAAAAETAAENAAASGERYEAAAREAARLSSEGETRDDGEWRYVILPETGWAVVVGHHDRGDAVISVPSVLGGGDVVAMLSGTFADHAALTAVTFPTNLYFAEDGALPRGTGVRGLHGTYAQAWAAAHRHAFENLSELDFVTGVVDCSDFSPEHFHRQSAAEVTVRSLEAERLPVGTVFFLPDPDDAFAVAYYRVTAREEAEGRVRLRCETPELESFLNSLHLENAPLNYVPGSFRPAPGVTVEEESGRAKLSGGRVTGPNIKLSDTIKLKNGASLTGSVNYSDLSVLSIDYQRLELNSFTITRTQKFNVSFSIKKSLYKSGKEAGDTIEDLISQYAKDKPAIDGTDFRKDLGYYALGTLWGIVTLDLEVALKGEISASGEISYTAEDVTEYTYQDGRMVQKSPKKTKTHFNVAAKIEGKAGIEVSLKLYLTVVEVASLDIFVGFKASLAYEMELTNPLRRVLGLAEYCAGQFMKNANFSGETKEQVAALYETMETEQIPLGDVNRLDCLSLKVNFIIELSYSIGLKIKRSDQESVGADLLNDTWTLLDAEVLNLHCHVLPWKLVYNAEAFEQDDFWKIGFAWKEFPGDYLHDANFCPLGEEVMLMVPEIDASKPFGFLPLYGRRLIERDQVPELDLTVYHYRVKNWYSDKALKRELTYPYPVKSGDRIYASAEEVMPAHLIDYKGDPLLNTEDEPVTVQLAEGEETAVSSLKLKNEDHLTGWYKVKSAEDRAYLPENFVSGAGMKLKGDGTEQYWMAVFDNDLTLRFMDEKGKQLGQDITWGHNIPFPKADGTGPRVPSPGEKWEDGEHYGTCEYTWVRRSVFAGTILSVLSGSSSAVTFPYTETSGAQLVEFGIESTKLVHTDPLDYGVTETAVGGGGGADLSGLTVYSDPKYFTKTNSGSGVIVTGIQKKQTVVNADGTTSTYDIDPKAISIPAKIDGKPVTGISAGAFKGNLTLVYAKLPGSVQTIGSSAFANCPALQELDLSACGELAIPNSFAEKDGRLDTIRMPSRPVSIGNKAFQDCASIESVRLNVPVGEYAFSGCTKLAEVKMGHGVTSIGERAFSNCSALTELKVPCSAQKVGNNFIYGCTALSSLIFDGAPAKVTKDMLLIGPDSHLQSVKLGIGVGEIGNSAFSNGSYKNPNLTDIELPNTAVKMGTYLLSGTAVKRLKVYYLQGTSGSIARGCSTLEEITLEGGIIAPSSFWGCTNLRSVTMGKLVTGIGDESFKNCTSLEEITLGSGIQGIGKSAFYGCTALRAVDMKACGEMKVIGYQAFYNCKALEELELPESIESYGTELLSGCAGLKKLTLGGSACPVLSGGNGSSLLNLPASSELTEIKIREGVTELGDKLFINKTKLTRVSLPESLTVIGKQVFSGAKALTTLVLGPRLKEIGERAFQSCEALQTVFRKGSHLEIIGKEAFSGCLGMKSLDLGDSLKETGEHAFYNCKALEELHFPATMVSYGKGQIEGCVGLKTLSAGGPACPVLTGDKGEFNVANAKSALETIQVHEGVTEIDWGAFRNYYDDYQVKGYEKLTSVSLPSTLKKIGTRAFRDDLALETVNFPASLEEIGDAAFKGCKVLKPALPEEGLSVSAVGESAFEGCAAMERMVFADRLVSVGKAAFKNCSGLTELKPGKRLVSIGSQAFSGCRGLEEIPLEEGLRTIGDEAFAWCPGLKKLILPESVETYGKNLIWHSGGIKTLILGGPACPVLSGINVFNTQDTAAQMETIVIRDGVTELSEAIFANYWYDVGFSYGFHKLTRLELPRTLEIIGNKAFYGCDNLKHVDIPDAVRVIGEDAFRKCAALQPAFTEYSRLEEIGKMAFYGCRGMTSFRAGGRLKSVGDRAFEKCTGLQSLELPESVETYGRSLILGCSALRLLKAGGPACPVIPAGVFHIDNDSAYNSLETLIISEGVTAIGAGAFECSDSGSLSVSGFRKLTRISFPSTLDRIEEYAFRNAVSLGAVGIPSHTAVHEHAFDGCPNFERVAMDTPRLTLFDGETELFSGLVRQGEDLSERLSAMRPADTAEGTPVGWSFSAEGDPAGMPLEMPAFDLTLYAVRTPLCTVLLSTVRNGQAEPCGEMLVGAGLPVPWPEEPAAAGFHLAGWYYDEKLTVPFEAGAAMPSEGLHLYGDLRSTAVGAVYTYEEDHAELIQYIPDGDRQVWLPAYAEGLPVTVIAAGAFAQAGEIESLHLPDLLERMDPSALNDLPRLRSLSIGSGNPHYAVRDGVLYNGDMTRLIRCPMDSRLSLFIAPSTLREIGDSAFEYCTGLKTADLGENVVSIGQKAFASCTGMISFTAFGLQTVGEEAFLNDSGPLRIYGPVGDCPLRDALVTKEGVLLIPYNRYGVNFYLDGSFCNSFWQEAGKVLPLSQVDESFSGEEMLTGWFTDEAMTRAWDETNPMPAADLSLYTASQPVYTWEEITADRGDGTTVTGILLTGYRGRGGDLVLPESLDGKPVIALGPDFLKDSRGTVHSVTIGADVIQIADTALQGPENYPFGGLVKADEGSYAAAWAEAHGYRCGRRLYVLSFETFGGAPLLSRNVEWKVEVRLPVPERTGSSFLGWYTDQELKNAAELTEGCYIMPAHDVQLYAAWDGEGTALDYQYTADEGGATITGYTGELQEIVLPEEINGLPVIAVGQDAFRFSDLVSVTIPDSVRSLGDRAFLDCDRLERVEIGSGVEQIGAECFAGTVSLREFAVSGGNGVFRDAEGVLFNSVSLLYYPAARDGAAYALPEGTVSIGAYAFSEAENLRTVELPSSLQSIGAYAFQNCRELESFLMDGGLAVPMIPEGCFMGCSSLAEVRLSERVGSIGALAFYGCPRLTRLESPGTETLIVTESPVFSGDRLTIYCKYDNPLREYALSHGIAVIATDRTELDSLTVTMGITVLGKGESAELSCRAEPANAAGADQVSWSSSDPSVLYIRGNRVYGVRPGSAVLTVRAANGVEAYAEITVRGLEIHRLDGNVCVDCGETFDLSGLRVLRLPAGLQTVGSQAFWGTGTQAVVVGDGCVSLEKDAFSQMPDLMYLSLPERFTVGEIEEALGETDAVVLLR